MKKQPPSPAPPADPPRRSLVASTHTEWQAHIHALGLKSVDQYRRWCRSHGFAFNRKKTWRQEREERRVAELERSDRAAFEHIRALGLKTVEEYQDWCRRHGFRDRLQKKARQRHKERAHAAGLAPSPAPVDSSGADAAHWASLGLADKGAYDDWCRRHGLDPNPNKTAGALASERALAALELGKRQAQDLKPFIADIAAGRLEDAALQTPLLRRLATGFAVLDDGDRIPLRRLLLHLADSAAGIDLLAAGAVGSDRRPGCAWIDGVCALGRWSDAWVRAPEDWQPTPGTRQSQFAALARHLLAQYPVPSFMDAVFFLPKPENPSGQQAWFVHLAQGGNIRTQATPIALSKKMAHCMLEAPEALSPLQAMRWGQARGYGCSPAQATALAVSLPAAAQADEDFWSSVVQFFARFPDLEAERVQGLVDYINQRKFAQDDGEDPPEPNFSMKSRSLAKLERQARRWRAAWEAALRLSPETEEEKPKGGRRRFSHYFEQQQDGDRTLEWTIQELGTARSLAREGDSMRHCVATYSNQLGRTSLWSMQVREEGRTHRVLTIAIDSEKETITQVRGRFNADPENEVDANGVPLAGPVYAKGRLNRLDRDYLRRSTQILRAWVRREGIYYSKI